MHALDQQGWCRALGNYSAPVHGAAAFNGVAVRRFEEKSRWQARSAAGAIRSWRRSNAGVRWARYVHVARQVWAHVWAA